MKGGLHFGTSSASVPELLFLVAELSFLMAELSFLMAALSFLVAEALEAKTLQILFLSYFL